MRRVYVLPATGKTKLTSDVRKTQNGKRLGMTQDPKGRGADPDWLDPRKDRKTPYSDQELELLVEGFVSSMGDVADWNQMVKEIGEIKATFFCVYWDIQKIFCSLTIGAADCHPLASADPTSPVPWRPRPAERDFGPLLLPAQAVPPTHPGSG